MTRKKICALPLLTWAVLAGLGPQARGADIAVVLGSDSAPYMEALAGFQEAYGKPVDIFNLVKGEPAIASETRVLVTIGGKAALYPYETRKALLIYCMAPGIYVDPQKHPGRQIKVYVSPPPRLLLQKLKELQPGLRRLGAFWIGESAASYGKTLEQEGKSLGVSVFSARLQSLAELPDHLRAIKGRVDAFWIPPDPLLITPQSVGVMRQFALDNALPLYASIDGLADKGVAASVSVSFREMGRKAGSLAVQALAGSVDDLDAVYGDHVLLTINTGAAAQSGLSVPADVLKKAGRVIP
jgi:putative ABC transport system substrate-binding protein